MWNPLELHKGRGNDEKCVAVKPYSWQRFHFLDKNKERKWNISYKRNFHFEINFAL